VLKSEDTFVVKISDFGMAKYVDNSEEYSEKNENITLPMKWLIFLSLEFPDLTRAAPENFSGIFSFKSDVYSFGISLWEIFSLGKLPFQEFSNQDVKEFTLGGEKKLEKPELCSSVIWRIIQR
jgi:serine/threonine protein kinase